jgi:SecD/SecF fusion protein
MHIFPRLFNFVLVSIILGLFYLLIQAQEPVSTPVPATPVVPAATAETEPAAQSPDAAAPTFPVQDGEPNSAASFEKPAETPADEHQVKGEAAPPRVPFHKTAWFTLLVFLVILFGSLWVGNYCAKIWRLPEHNVKIFVVVLAFVGSFAALALGWHRLTLGIDLQGGVVLIYDAKPAARGGEVQDANAPGGLDMDQLARAITKRINPGGVREISITKLGTKQIQVVIPHAEAAEVARIERVISESGALTFRIIASKLYPQDAEIIKRGESTVGKDVLDASGRVLARWVPVFESEKSSFQNNPDYATRQRGNNFEVLVLYNDGVDITGEYLTTVGRGMGERGDPGVSFNFNSIGEHKFERLTSANRPDPVQTRLVRNLGIILNDNLYSAPVIRNVIRGHGIIEFAARHTDAERQKLQKDIDDLISILDAGALPAELSKEPVGRMLIGATLGNDTIQKATYALAASAIATIVFMIVYYRLAGMIACFCVITNATLIVAVMLALRAAFTLPGLAGLVLTIGMAVDANILIYERIREELAGGSSLKMAIRNGYGKAFSAIFDSNITTILVGIILYWVGTEQVKGFAVTLVLGVALNMFTAIYCARVIMDVLEAQRWVKTFSMLQLFKRPNINFLAARNVCISFSVILLIVGLIAVVARGRGLLDIDFVGGVSVEAVFKDSQSISEVRSKLYAKDKTIAEDEYRLNDLAVQNVQMNIGEDGQNVTPDTHFIITTSIPQVKGKEILPDAYLDTVRGILKDTFGDALEYGKFQYEIGESKKVADYDETTATVKVFPKINHDALKSEMSAAIKKAILAKLIDSELSAPTITREGFVEGSQAAFEDWTLTFHTSKEVLDKVLNALKIEKDNTPNFPTSTTVGGSVARDTRIAGSAAVIASLIMVILYIWLRFHRLVYGIVAVIGLIHDVLIVLGLIALSAWLTTPILQIEEFKIGLPVVAAFLTIIGYSINDTIILFDRIRENLGKSPVLTGTMINTAVNQTLSRTVLTSLTTFLVSFILYLFGGQGIHVFAFAMTLGVVFGTYSTIAVCSPLLFWAIGMDDLAQKKAEAISER